MKHSVYAQFAVAV